MLITDTLRTSNPVPTLCLSAPRGMLIAAALANVKGDFLEAALLTGATNFKVARFIATVRKFPAGSSNAWQSPE
ncbi:hypothetical protein [Corynebacterium cystitidis]|uniref:hypothetical protein n=1 Tax=Corynebacterium cystitidis TaxID=35757 RepID=UPI00211EC02D|nr:hypothetical protein [Corynebacterium cystitidis]